MGSGVKKFAPEPKQKSGILKERKNQTLEKYIRLYNENDLEIMALAKACKKPGSSRIEEIKKYAIQAGYKKIGIAYCTSVTKYAQQLEDYFKDIFDVVKIDCKCAKIPASMLLNGAKGISCNPAGQAKILEDAGTEFNIALALCLGHDIIFNNKSKAPATTLIVKDKAHHHNTIEGFTDLQYK